MKFLIALFVISYAVACFAMSVKNDICKLPTARIGDDNLACMGMFEMFSYNAATNECVNFIYGGCGGNANRFDTVEECEKLCKK